MCYFAKEEKAGYFNKLDLNLVRDNKMFWMTISPYFVNPKKNQKLRQLAKCNTLSEDEKIAETFKKFLKAQCGFRKGCSTHYSIIAMIKK